MTTVAAAPIQDPTPGEVAGRIFEAAVAAFDILSIHLGDRLGLYRALVAGGPATAEELASRAGIDPRYAREWLEQQAATGLLRVEADGAGHAASRRFRLPAGAAEALVDPENPYSVAPLARSLVACAAVMPELLAAYRTGGGVPWTSYGTEMVEAQGDFNRPWLLASLGNEYLPAIPDVDRRLRADPPARVADVACGVGWASIAMARAYPGVRVDGFDLDEASIERATAHAADAGLADRVTFIAGDAARPAAKGAYDLAIIVEAIHDLSRPVDVLRAIREMLAPGGTAIVADEKTADAFTAPADAAERLFYGYSITCCLPAAMADQPSAATGTVMRTSTMEAYAREAGFAVIDLLDLPHDFLRFYRLTP
jgi:2-polyprenyl-3-methyl-5-hydroxy-6-metoxy-1,4-benzoquinol methylase